MKFRILLCAAALAVSGTFAGAADEPQVIRQEMMKKVGGAVGALSKVVKGETPYDSAAVLAQLQAISDTMATFADQFPAGSETGMDSEAAPAIWENPEDFRAKADKLKADADAAIAAAPADAAALGALFGPIAQNCGACHQTYRLKNG
jgi:Cytochrome c556